MNNAVSSTKNFTFDHVTGNSQENKFRPEEYGEACDLFDRLSREMESKYGKERMS